MKCEYCGCTDEDCSQCIEKTNHPCMWVKPNVCSVCNFCLQLKENGVDTVNKIKIMGIDMKEGLLYFPVFNVGTAGTVTTYDFNLKQLSILR